MASRRPPLLMVFVVDASVVAGWFLPDERAETSDALAFRMRSEDAIAPDLFGHEARSLLLTALWRGPDPRSGGLHLIGPSCDNPAQKRWPERCRSDSATGDQA
jgi:hypothetical protein